MKRTVNETQEYVISLTCHVRKGDVSAAILAVLFELGFQTYVDGFWYLRKAILIRCENPDIRLSAIYQEIIRITDSTMNSAQVEQAILSCIATAWDNKNREQWDYFFSEETMGRKRKPSNKEFIAQLACVMELWCSHCKEVSYGNE